MNPRRYSEYGQMKYLTKTLNLLNAFLLQLVTSNVGSKFKILRMYWYSSMRPFRTNLKLVMNKNLFSWHVSFPGVDSSYIDLTLSGMIENISS